MLSTYCPKCGNSKIPADAIFCNQCGWILGTAGVESIQRNDIVDDNFLEYILSEYGLKIKYPATWTKVDTDLPPPAAAVFFSPMEDPSDSFNEHLVLGVVDMTITTTLEELRDGNLRDLNEKNSDFILHESVPTTIAGIPAWHLIFTSGGQRTLAVYMIRGNRLFIINYVSQPEKYFKFLSIVEQMITSIEFLS